MLLKLLGILCFVGLIGCENFPIDAGQAAAQLASTNSKPRLFPRLRVTADVAQVQPLGVFEVLYPFGWVVVDHTTSNTILLKSLRPSARHYLYATAGGVPRFITSEIEPDDQLSFAAGDSSLKFVSTLITDSKGAVIPYTQSGNNYVYAQPSGIDTYDPLIMLRRGTSSSRAFITTAPAIPAVATSMTVALSMETTGLGRVGSIYNSGGALVVQIVDAGAFVSTQAVVAQQDGRLQYSVSAGSVLSVLAVAFTL